MRRGALVAATLALAVLLAGPEAAPAQAGSDGLIATSDATYTVAPDGGGVFVTLSISLENNDPATVLNEFGTSYYYEFISIPILPGASPVSATGPAGDGLFVELQPAGADPFALVSVTFGHGLFYGDTYELTLTYQVLALRTSYFIVSPYYVNILAMTPGIGSSTVHVDVPDGPGWEVTVQPADCEQTGVRVYQCGDAEHVQAAALVEVARPSELERTTSTAELGGREIELTFRFFPGEEAWAAHIGDVVEAGLPLLEELFGFPYPSPTELLISEGAQRQILGHAGIVACGATSCSIGLSPTSDDRVVLHELAHLWSLEFESTWLNEGLAEFMARKAVDALGPLVTLVEFEEDEPTVHGPLDEWAPNLDDVLATDEVLEEERSGYLRSLRMIEQLEETIGVGALQHALVTATADEDPVDSERFFDVLEETTGTAFDALFLEEVFPAEYDVILDQRREARAKLALLRPAIEEAGLELPAAIERDVDDWEFVTALEQLRDARRAVTAYRDAQEAVAASRSPIEKLGLLFEDPEGDLENAADGFARGRYDETVRLANDASSAIDDANRLGLYRLLAAAGIVSGALLAVVAIVFLLRRRRRRTLL